MALSRSRFNCFRECACSRVANDCDFGYVRAPAKAVGHRGFSVVCTSVHVVLDLDPIEECIRFTTRRVFIFNFPSEQNSPFSQFLVFKDEIVYRKAFSFFFQALEY
jgi:hypothetical protein